MPEGIANVDDSEIEVTPAMIEAGMEAWSEYDERFEGADEMIERVYRAMMLKAKDDVCVVAEGCAG